MKRLLPLLCLLSLASCQKHHIASYSADPWLYNYAPIPGGLYIVMGQSNAERMYQYGLVTMIKQLQAKSITNVSAVNCAVGGSSEASWAPGAVNYNVCLSLVQAAHLPIAGIIFWQGEAEGARTDVSAAQNWNQNFTYLMNNFRVAIGAPTVKVTYARISNQAILPLGAIVRASQEDIFMPNVEMINVDGIPTLDGLHYTPDNYQALLLRFTKEF